MKKHLFKISLVFTCLGITLCFSSCSTAFMKASPFYTGQVITGVTSSGKSVRWDDPEAVKIKKIFAHDFESKMDDERGNVWPIFFKNFQIYSILWPLAEVNDVGWEVRPFVSVDNYEQDYRILSGGWNSKENSNYILPFYVKNDDGFFSLPFSRLNDGKYGIYNYMLFGGYFSSDDTSYLFPLYAYDGTDETLYTLICSFSRNFGYIFPIYFYDRHNYQGGEKFSNNILPPFGNITYFSGDEESYCEEAYFFPFVFYNRDNLSHRYMNPKYEGKKFKYKNRPKDYWLHKESVEKNFTLFPLIFFSDNEIKKQNSYVVFPLFFSGKDKAGKNDKEWMAVIPFFIYEKDGKDYFSNFMMFAGTKGKYIDDKPYHSSFILPAYYYDYDEINHRRMNPKYKGKNIDWKKRPKDYYIRESTVAKNSFYFPSIFTTKYENNAYDSVTGFPFYFQGHDKRYDRDSEWFSIFPCYFSEREKENYYKNYGILAGTREEKILDKKYSSSYVLPFYNYDYRLINHYLANPKYKGRNFHYTKTPKDYYVKRETVSRENFYFPSIFTEEYENGDYDEFTLFPFYFNGHDRRYGRDKDWNVVFPFYFYEREKQDISKNYLCFAGTKSTKIADKKYDSSYVLPFYYYEYYRNFQYEVNPKYKGKKFKHNERPSDYNLVTETPKKKTYIFPNYFAEDNPGRGTSEYSIFPFVFYEKNKRYEKTGSPFSVYQRKKWFHNDNLTSQFLWYFYYYDRDQTDITEYIFPSYYSYTNRKANHTVSNFFPFTFHEKTNEMDSFGTFLWLYTSRNNLEEKKIERQALWYLYYNEYYAENKEEKTEEYESSRILWKVYHRESKGETTNIDVFPFISYSDNKERSRFSFAWRFFSLENSEKATKVHLLYIPVWW